MGETLRVGEPMQLNQFRVDYPYYGLFGSAEVTTLTEDNGPLYQCKLLNGSVVVLRKQVQPKRWVDARLERETPLSAVLGNSIDDFLNSSGTAGHKKRI